LCRGRQSRTDRDCRHKRNRKLTRDCLLCWLHLLSTWNARPPFRLFRFGTRRILS
jgi:hypothetical protein